MSSHVTHSHSYPLRYPPPASSMESDVNTPPPPSSSSSSSSDSPSLPHAPDILLSPPSSLPSSSQSDKKEPPKTKQGKATLEEAKIKKGWRASGSVVQHKLIAWKPDEPLDLSHLNIDSVPKPLLKSDSLFLSLKHLNLSFNKLSSLPPQIALLRSLVTLDCTFNRLSDLPLEMADLLSLEHLQLSGNPLSKDLMQRHLLGTASVMQYLKERQAAEQGKVRKSNKFKSLRSSSDPDNKPREEALAAYSASTSASSSDPATTSPLLTIPPILTIPSSSSPSSGGSLSSAPRNLSASDNAIKNRTLPLTRQRSGPSQPLSHSTTLTSPSTTSSSSPSASSAPSTPQFPSPSGTPPPGQQTPPPPEPRGDMGPIISQLKFGIIYTETVKSLSVSSPPEPPGKQRAVSHGSAEDYIHNFNGTGTLITSSTHGTKEKFTLRDGEGRFTFNTYCTAAFLELRNISNVTQDRYLAALESISALGFAGKSGAILLKSADGLLVLKTISKDEAKFLRKIMPQVLTFMKNNPKTYLTRFWGLYKVIRSPLEKVNFVVMRNAFHTTKKIHERYDLKGSTVGRTTDEENVRRSRIVLKDLNFNRQIRLGPERAKVFMAQIAKDTEFLQKFDIIDYSLIVGVHYLFEAPTKDPVAEYPIEGEIQAMDKEEKLLDEVYFLAIIDMLQPFNIRKQMEYNLKTIRYGPGISVIPPENYAARFVSFIQSIVE